MNRGVSPWLGAGLVRSVEVAFQEHRDGGVGDPFIREAHDAVSFIREDEELHRFSLGSQGLDQLLRLAQRNPGIIGALDDQEGRHDGVDVVEGGDVLQECPILVEAAVLGFPVLPSIAAGVR